MGLKTLLGVGKTGVLYDSDAQLYFNQLTGTISNTWKGYINKYIVKLKADGNWTADRLWLHATENQQNARISMRNPTSTAITEVNSPTWTLGQGYTGNGSNMYLNTNCAPSTAGNYALNSAAIGVYIRTNTNGVKEDIGVWNGLTSYTIIDARDANLFNADINDTTGQTVANTSSQGFFAMNRSSNTTTSVWKNGVNLATRVTNPSTAVATQNFYLLSRNNNGTAVNFSDRQIALSVVGDNSMNQATFYSATQELMTNLGIQV